MWGLILLAIASSEVLTEHLRVMFCNRSCESYKPSQCDFTLTEKVNFKHNRGGWGMYWGKHLQEYAIGVSGADYTRAPKFPCLAYSVAERYSHMAFLTEDDWKYAEIYGTEGKPYSQRKKIPVWRGTLWHEVRQPFSDLQEFFILSKNARNKIVAYSAMNQHEVDAKVAALKFKQPSWQMWRENLTNGLHALLPVSPIQESDYYNNYQVHFVLSGIGAAFRLTRVLHSGSAAIIEDFKYKLWYVRFLIPYIHYIPLAEHAANLSAVLFWVNSYPSKVATIAANGKRFANTHLHTLPSTRQFYDKLHECDMATAWTC